MKSANWRFLFILEDCYKFRMGIEIFSQLTNSGILESFDRVHRNAHYLGRECNLNCVSKKIND